MNIYRTTLSFFLCSVYFLSFFSRKFAVHWSFGSRTMLSLKLSRDGILQIEGIEVVYNLEMLVQSKYVSNTTGEHRSEEGGKDPRRNWIIHPKCWNSLSIVTKILKITSWNHKNNKRNNMDWSWTWQQSFEKNWWHSAGLSNILALLTKSLNIWYQEKNIQKGRTFTHLQFSTNI